MSITSVFPPTSTPGGWYGCFGPPGFATDPYVAWPVSGQVPCGNGTVESCCIIGDQCLSNGVCQILPVANNGQDPLYYGAYCTDPTFSSPECTANCAVRYMAYCGSNDLWQCGYTDRTHPISCNLSDTTTSDSSTFFMIEPSKLAKGLVLPSTEPTTTESQYIPTQWRKPTAAAVSPTPTVALTPISSTLATSTISLTTSTSRSSTAARSSTEPISSTITLTPIISSSSETSFAPSSSNPPSSTTTISPVPSDTPTSNGNGNGNSNGNANGNANGYGTGLSGSGIAAVVSIATILGVPLAIIAILVAIYPDRTRRGCTGFWKFVICR